MWGQDMTTAELTVCTKCGQAKLLEKFYWEKRRNRPRCWCKVCEAKYRIQYRKANAEKERQRIARWAKANPEKMRAAKKRHYKAHTEDMRAARRQYYEAHQEEEQEYHRHWCKINPEQSSIIDARARAVRRSRKEALSTTLTAEEWKAALAIFGHRCAYCGCEHARFHKDHVTPVSKGGGFEAGNIVPACSTCNKSKNKYDVEPWMKRKGYDYERFAKKLMEINDGDKGIRADTTNPETVERGTVHQGYKVAWRPLRPRRRTGHHRCVQRTRIRNGGEGRKK